MKVVFLADILEECLRLAPLTGHFCTYDCTQAELNEVEPLPITAELLQKNGFIREDFEEDSFLLPVLSIQPLVENAVKHGIAKKRGGGVVTISSSQTEDAYQIVITDTGVGFDVDRYMDDGKVHVGLMNVRQRLQSRMNATVDIDSKQGEGTTVTVTIPKEKVSQ